MADRKDCYFDESLDVGKVRQKLQWKASSISTLLDTAMETSS